MSRIVGAAILASLVALASLPVVAGARVDRASGRGLLLDRDAPTRSLLVPHAPARAAARDQTWKQWLDKRRGETSPALEAQRAADPGRGIQPLDSPSLPFGIGDVIDLPAQSFPLLSADFDGNARPDFAAVADGANRVVIGINDGNGGFVLDSLLVPAPSWAAAGDFNGDGWIDLAVLCGWASADFRIFRGRGDGHFDDAGVYPVGSEPWAIAAHDLDRDGLDDIVVTISAADSITVVLSAGNSFEPPVSYPASPGPGTLLVTDFNQDSLPDLVVSHLYSSDIALYLNVGGGVLGERVEFAGNYLAGFAAADLNGDGFVDLAAAPGYGGLLQIYWNNGLSAFGSREDHLVRDEADQGSVAIGDLDGDGLPDLAVLAYDRIQEESWAHLFFGLPNHTFDGSLAYFTATAYSGRSYGSVAIADFDGVDGADLLVTHHGPSPSGSGRAGLLLLRHLEGRAFAGLADSQLPGGSPMAQAVDFERRGQVDLLVDTGMSAYLLRSRDDGMLGPAASFPAGAGAIAIDLNADVRTDLLTPLPDSIAVRRCNSQGTIGSPTFYSTGGTYLGTADFDGDGKPDVLVRRSTGTLAVLMNDGSGAFGAPLATNVSVTQPVFEPVGAGDLDGDGRIDLAIGKRGESKCCEPPPDSVRVLLAGASLTFTPVGTFPVAACTLSNCVPLLRRIECMDVNGDSLKDVVAFSTVNTGIGIVSVLRNLGGGTLASPAAYQIPPEDQVFFAGDLDGDRSPDLASVSYDDFGVGTLWLARNHGDGTFGPARALTTSNYPRCITSGDLDGDGRIDLIVGYRGYEESPGILVLLDNVIDPPAVAAMGILEGSFVAGRVRLVWQAGVGKVGVPNVERRTGSAMWTVLGLALNEGSGRYRFEDASVLAGERYAYRLVVGSGFAARYSPVFEVEIPIARFALEAVFPNPTRGPLSARYTLAGEERAALELVDVAGRRLARQDIEHPLAGPSVARLSSARLRPGVYWIRLSQGPRMASAKVIVTR